jgi:hypothetical protein
VFKTDVIKKTLNPSFQKEFEILIVDRHLSVLKFELLDWDLVGAHDALGVVDIPLAALSIGQKEEVTLRLNKSETGEITVSFLFIPSFIRHQTQRQLRSRQTNESVGQSLSKIGSFSGKLGHAAGSFTGAFSKRINKSGSNEKLKLIDEDQKGVMNSAAYNSGSLTLSAFTGLFGTGSSTSEPEMLNKANVVHVITPSKESFQNNNIPEDSFKKSNSSEVLNRHRSITTESLDSSLSEIPIHSQSLETLRERKGTYINCNY